MKVLILSTAFSGLVQRVLTELQALNHEIEEHYDLNERSLIDQVQRFKPEVVVCPFLTQRIPPVVWKNYLCLVVHPGIEGDRGPSSLDWAISEAENEWGVTLLQASEDYDAGDIWGTRRFSMRKAAKTSIYKREVTEATIELLKQALDDIEFNDFTPRPLIYDSGMVKGRKRPLMSQTDRRIDWSATKTELALCKLNAADSRPGVRAKINGVEVNMYGGVEEPRLSGEPGRILGVYKGAICCATQDSAIWIKQLKCIGEGGFSSIKLPASWVLKNICPSKQLESIPFVQDASVIDDIKVEFESEIAYVYFNFYNGAMNTAQCIDLKNTIINLKKLPIKMIVLMGGEDFWSNGIHLNCIEASDDPARESWNNINGMNDLVYEIIESPSQIMVSALRNNAGAGGVVLAAASDEVIIRQGVVLNPHYKTIGLYGSEYWTYLLPKRIGENKAHEITEACLPMSSNEAVRLGLADIAFDEAWRSYHISLKQHCQHLVQAVNIDDHLKAKYFRHLKDSERKALSECRKNELAIMKKAFFNENSSYHAKRRAFVFKQKSPKMLAKSADILRRKA